MVILLSRRLQWQYHGDYNGNDKNTQYDINDTDKYSKITITI